MKFKDKQNEKIKAITESTLVIGCDIAKVKHVARAIDFRGIELGKPLPFDNTEDGFRSLALWVKNLQSTHQKTNVMFGVEPTGHYWMSLAEFIQGSTSIQLVLVNPYHTKRSKELDDNSPTKNDTKDARVIAKLVSEGRYWMANIPTGDYAELRAGMIHRQHLQKMLSSTKGHIHTWLDRYFPEFTTVFKDIEGKTALTTLQNFPMPQDITTLNTQEVIDVWRTQVVRCVGLKKALALQEAARRSVGCKNGNQFARVEIQDLLVHYKFIKEQMDALMSKVAVVLERLPETKAMLSIPGVGLVTVAVFLAETGDLRNYSHWRQIVRLAGLNLQENSSGKHVGKTTISKRGRSELRALLFRTALILVAKNPEMKALHQYFTTRKENQLKKMQSIVAICGKLIRLLFTLGRKHCVYQADKALGEDRLQQIRNAA
jgi:transposase